MNRKKYLYILLSAAVGIVFLFYFISAFRRGVWYQNRFLYQIQENEWHGTFYSNPLHLIREQSDNNIYLHFTWGAETKTYTISYTEADNMPITILDGATPIFHGYYIENRLLDSSGTMQYDISIQYAPHLQEPDWHPSETQLVQLAFLQSSTFHGNIPFLFLVILISIILILDIKFPLLFFYLRHSLSVSNPEPTSFYYAGQFAGRLILCLIIGFLMIYTFIPA